LPAGFVERTTSDGDTPPADGLARLALSRRIPREG
jgi:hypothetical protein